MLPDHGERTHLTQLKPLPVIIDERHQLQLRIEVFLLMDDAQVVEAQMCHIFPVERDTEFLM